MKIFLVLALFSSFYSIDEITYHKKIGGYIRRFSDEFKVTFNRYSGIKAEYLLPPYRIHSKGRKYYNLTCEELGLPSLKELFKLFDKINFPEETNWKDSRFFDLPFWHLYVDKKDYYSNGRPDFLKRFDEIVNIKKIKEYCKKKY